MRRRLRGEQTGCRATTSPLSGSNGARGHVCPQWRTTRCVSMLSFALPVRASVLVPSLSLSFVFFFLMLFTCCFSLLVCSAVPVCWAFLRNHILNSKHSHFYAMCLHMHLCTLNILCPCACWQPGYDPVLLFLGANYLSYLPISM